LAKIEIRRLGPGDASVLDRVATDVFDHAISKKRLTVYLREPNHLLFVAICDGEVVGQARGMIHLHPDMEDELYIDNLGVAPAFQRRRIGTRLIKALLEEGRNLGCAEAWVGTEENNIVARKFYESLGDSGELCVFFTYGLQDSRRNLS
jgi:ribosomal protein S18 acetylase RimI-like enzyme